MNTVCLSGRLTAKPELQTSSDRKYAKFSIAVKRDFSKDTVDFINCVAFGNTAEYLTAHADKGSMLNLVGKINISNYEKDGVKKSSYTIVCDNLSIITNYVGGNDTPAPEAAASDTSSASVPTEDDLELDF